MEELGSGTDGGVRGGGVERADEGFGDGSDDALRCLLAMYDVSERNKGVGSGQCNVCKFGASMNRKMVEVNAVNSWRAGREAKDW